MIGTSSPMSFCEISELFRICVDGSLGFRGPDHGADELGLQIRAGRELRQRVVYFDSGFRNHAATVKRITNCGELHRIGDVVIGSHLQQRTGHRVGCFCQAALSFCTDLRCASTVLGTHVCTVDCGSFATVAVFFYALYSDVRALRVSRFPTTLHST